MIIPISEFKIVIKESWYPNTPDYIIDQDIISIQKRMQTNKYNRHIKSCEIVELFKIHGKPNMFEQEDYEQYIKSHEKRQPFNKWLSNLK